MQTKLLDEQECDLVEVSSHYDARPEHALWQGQIYSRSGKHSKYKPFKICGLGTLTGLCGINCRHSFFPYFEGMPKASKEYDLEETKKNYEERQKRKAKENNRRLKKLENVFISKNTLLLSENFTYSQLIEKVRNNWNYYQNMKTPTKSDVLKFLDKIGFKDKVFVCKTPKVLENYEIKNEDIYLAKSDLAYILSKHHGQLTIEQINMIRNTIVENDLIFKNPNKTKQDSFLFFKYVGDKGGALELAISRNPYNLANEYIMHFHYMREKTVKEKILKLTNK